MTAIAHLKQPRPEGIGTTCSGKERLELLTGNSVPDKSVFRNQEEMNTYSEEGKVRFVARKSTFKE